jgi:hypothetical protein
MAIKKATKELVEGGSHRVKVSTVQTKPRQYQGACRTCDWKGTSGVSGSKADREALEHAKATLGQVVASMDSPTP